MEQTDEGLPEHSHWVVLREAMATDTLEDARICVGTSTGQIFFSRDASHIWELLADYLPPV